MHTHTHTLTLMALGSSLLRRNVQFDSTQRYKSYTQITQKHDTLRTVLAKSSSINFKLNMLITQKENKKVTSVFKIEQQSGYVSEISEGYFFLFMFEYFMNIK